MLPVIIFSLQMFWAAMCISWTVSCFRVFWTVYYIIYYII
jgi:hypothetical protein